MDEKTTPAPAAKKGKHPARAVARAEKNASFHYTMDAVLAGGVLVLTLILAFPLGKTITDALQKSDEAGGAAFLIIFGIPLAIACFYYARPLRFGGAVAAILLVYSLFYQSNYDQGTVYRDRSYFGFIRVRESASPMPTDASGSKMKNQRYTNLMHGNIDHGKNFQPPDDKKLRGNPFEDYSRLPTTYYHRLGPAGRVMNRFNWGFKTGPDFAREWNLEVLNSYPADARMPGSQIGLIMSQLNASTLPLASMVGVFSEPPYATIGLGTGTMAAYGRPFQHVHFYEIDDHIRRLSLPLRGQRYFNYLQGAIDRGAYVQVLMGDARLRMAFPYETYNEEQERYGKGKGGGPENFYHMMVVDAFSSDAIPVHLLTREAFIMYFQKLHPQGILAVHTSNRYVDLVKVVADVANDITMVEVTDFGDSNLQQRTQEKRVLDELNARLKSEGKRPVQYTDVWITDFGDSNLKQWAQQQRTLDKLNEGLKAQNKRPVEYQPISRLIALRGHDNSPGYGVTRSGRGGGNQFGHYTSEWVMVGRDRGVITGLDEPRAYAEKMAQENAERRRQGMGEIRDSYWQTPPVEGRHIWTDDYQSVLRVLR